MVLQVGDVAPAFKLIDSTGKELTSESLLGSKVWLSLYRSSACPLCNLQVSVVKRRFNELTSNGLKIVSVFESTLDELKSHAGTQATDMFPIYVPNEGTPADFPLYNAYERSHSCFGSVYGFASCYHCCCDCRMAPALLNFGVNPSFGCPLCAPQAACQLMCGGARVTTMPTDVLIAEDGKISAIFHGNFNGQHIAMEEVEAFAGLGVLNEEMPMNRDTT